MEVTVKISKIFEGELIESRDGSKSWPKQIFWAVDESNQLYPNELEFELFGDDKVNLLNGKHVGDLVTVHFNIKGNKWEPANKPARIFTKLDAWKIDPAQTATNPNSPEAVVSDISQDDSDDLPF